MDSREGLKGKLMEDVVGPLSTVGLRVTHLDKKDVEGGSFLDRTGIAHRLPCRRPKCLL